MTTRTPPSRRSPVPLVLVLGVYVVVAGIVALNKVPWCDEGWYGGPAINLLTHGSMGTPNFYYPDLPGVREYTYWEMPGFILVLAGWFTVVGRGLLEARLLTVLLGASVLLLWNQILRQLGIGVRASTVALALIAVDQYFILDATYVRADMLSMVFLAATFAIFLWRRETNLTQALVLANAAAVAAGLTHPNAGLLALIGLGVLAARDVRRLRLYQVLLCAIPYLVGGALWWLYIRQAPEFFASQFARNSSGRFEAIAHPLLSLRQEIERRYLLGFGLGVHSAGTPKLVVLKVVGLVVWACGVIGCLLDRELRAERATRLLLVMLGLNALYMAFFEGTRTTTYLVWLVPLYSALAGIWVIQEWERRPKRRWAAAALVALGLAVQASVSLTKARLQWGMGPFHQVVDYLQRNAHAGPVVASIEFGYALGFEPGTFYDDVSLGAWSGIEPAIVVIEDRYREWLPNPRPGLPRAVHDAARKLKTRCAPELDNVYYTVYRCR